MLTVMLRPVITVQPADQTAECFGSATFTVTATGNPGDALTYQWRLNGQDLPGENGTSLTVNNLGGENYGPYSVAVGNTIGTTISSNAYVTLTDPAAPIILCPDNMTVECGPVTFDVPAVNSCLYPVPVGCVPPSGSVFPAGTTTVNCETLNVVGPSASCSFQVTTADTQPPVIANCPADITTTNTVVTWNVTATDLCAGVVPVVCNPVSGSTFVVGTTPVVCTAQDGLGHTATCNFSVTVQGESQPISLTVLPQGASVLVSWPTSPVGFRLEYTTILGTGGQWQNYTGTLSTNGNTISTTVSAGGNMFFRLVKP